MRKRTIFIAVIGVLLIGFASVIRPQDRLIWNRTASAPIGFYWLNNAPFSQDRWVVVSASSDNARWASRRGYIGKDWPLLKKVAGVSGDEICRFEGSITLNGEQIAHAKSHDTQGRALPVWAGCIFLSQAEVFLINQHPDSLDGRYFGPTNLNDLDGVAALIWEF